MQGLCILLALLGCVDGADFNASVWRGSYECPSLPKVPLILNVTDSSAIYTNAQLRIETEEIPMIGAFASFLNMLTLQGKMAVTHNVGGQNFSNVELNGQLVNSSLIKGVMVFRKTTGTLTCPMELRVYTGKGNGLRFANSFSDHMVLQQAPASAVLWGYADRVGETVTVVVNGVKVANTTTFINPNTGSGASAAKWKVKLPPQSQHGPFSITAESSEGSVTLRDVMYGDVWLCSGQSNMQFRMREVYNSTAEIDDSLNYPNIRMLFSKLVTANSPQDDVVLQHPWIKPTKGFIEEFSALCFMFGRELQKTLKYPIGLIESNWGGTRIEAWSSPDALAKCQTVGKRADPNAESVLWNAMIHPYLATTIKGAIWYQGESNSGNPSKYACSFPTMISDWRQKFHAESMQETSADFPFGFVQLAPWRPDKKVVSGFPGLRWSQTVDVGYVPNTKMPKTFMAVAIDLPDFNSPSGSIHPRYKQDIAVRMSLGARYVGYGDDSVTFKGPFPSSFVDRPGDHRLQIEFDGGQATLVINNYNGFEVCCSTTTCQSNDWVQTLIVMNSPSMVEIDTSVCTAGKHVAGVRYLWRESPCSTIKQCPLYGQTNYLPVPPFIQNGPFNTTTAGATIG